MEHREMRRKDRATTGAEAREILEAGVYGVLSTVGEDGGPYGVPLSYVVDGGAVVFHCAGEGRKLDNLRRSARVSFAVVGADVQAYYDADFTTSFSSAIVFGAAEEVTDAGEKTRLLRLLCEKYLPEHMEHFEKAMQSLKVTAVWRIAIDCLTGKRRA